MAIDVSSRSISSARIEAPINLDEPPVRVLGWLDQLGLWGNLGVSLLGPVTAVYLLEPLGPKISYAAAFVALIVGTVVGSLLLGLAAIPGAETGSPAMVLLRGTFGAKFSWLPTLVNVMQLIGWATYEIVVIAQASQQLLPWHQVRWPYVLVAGALTTLLAARPLGAVRILRRYALVAVTLVTIYLFVELFRHPLPSLTHGGWHGFWTAADYAVAGGVSFAPMASDYTRHARSASSAFGAALIGYSVSQIAYYGLGLLALATIVSADSANLQHDMFAAFIALPVGWLAFGVLVARELDESFANSYSTIVSIQNLFPRADRRMLALIVVPVATVLALALNINSYANFLTLLGSVFVPLTAVFVVDYFLQRRTGSFDTSVAAPPRWLMVAPWLVGFLTYQLINPGYVGWWVRMWTHIDNDLHIHFPSWSSASVFSAVIAAMLAVPASRLSRRSQGR